MKKIYVSIAACLTTCTTLFAQAPACVATYSNAGNSGVYPTQATNFVTGTVGVEYRQDLTAIVPDDTLSSGAKVCFSRFELSSPSGVTNFGLPPGLSLSGPAAATASTYQFNAGQTSCAIVYGTPTAAGTYTLHLKVTAFGTIKLASSACTTPINYSGGGSLQSDNIDYYVITINQPNGVKEYGKDKFGLLQNQPNPFTDRTTIKYYVESEDDVTLSVYNTLGALVYQTTGKSKIGENTFELHAQGWTEGMYMYSVKYKNIVNTKRLMIVNNH